MSSRCGRKPPGKAASRDSSRQCFLVLRDIRAVGPTLAAAPQIPFFKVGGASASPEATLLST